MGLGVWLRGLLRLLRGGAWGRDHTPNGLVEVYGGVWFLRAYYHKQFPFRAPLWPKYIPSRTTRIAPSRVGG